MTVGGGGLRPPVVAMPSIVFLSLLCAPCLFMSEVLNKMEKCVDYASGNNDQRFEDGKVGTRQILFSELETYSKAFKTSTTFLNYFALP